MPLNGDKAAEVLVGLEQSVVVGEDRGSQCQGLGRQLLLLCSPQYVLCMNRRMVGLGKACLHRPDQGLQA